jgi:hypothetical protein
VNEREARLTIDKQHIEGIKQRQIPSPIYTTHPPPPPLVTHPPNPHSDHLSDGQSISHTIALAINNLSIPTRQLQQTPPGAAMLHVEAGLVNVVRSHEF